jgi:uncharacterized protein with FMN-binding domain
MSGKASERKKGRGFLKGCLVALLVFLVLLAVGGGIGWSFVAKEYREAASLPLNAVDFDALDDGTYHGVYAGGMYGWRYNECDVTVMGGKVSDIQLTHSADPGAENANAEIVYERVIQTQSLNVDTISGATLTSKGYLKAVENALVQAQHE